MRASFLSLLCLAAVLSVSADDSGASDVVTLTEADFDTQLSDPTNKNAWFVEFYAPWCGHCKRLAPTWEEAATELKGVVNIAKVDSTQHKNIGQRFGVRGFPTLLLFTSGPKNPIKYQGQRTLAGFKGFLDKNDALAPPEVIIKYFTARSKAEIIRLTLEVAGLEYSQQLHDGKQWPAVKKAGIESGEFPFGQVPAVQYGNVQLAQTMAIVRYIGKKKGLYPKDDKQAAQADVVLGGYDDLRNRYSKLVYAADFESKKADYVADVMPVWFGYFENLLKKAGGQHFVGATTSVADLAVFDLVEIHLPLDQGFLSALPTLQAHHAALKASKPITEYYASDRRPKFQNGAGAFFDNEAWWASH